MFTALCNAIGTELEQQHEQQQFQQVRRPFFTGKPAEKGKQQIEGELQGNSPCSTGDKVVGCWCFANVGKKQVKNVLGPEVIAYNRNSNNKYC